MAAFAGVKFDVAVPKMKLSKLKRGFPSVVSAILRTSAIHILIPEIRKRLKRNNNVFTGELHSRMNAKAGVDNRQPFVDIGAIGVPYGLNIEKGSPPHTPDQGRIEEYVRKKMGMSGSRVQVVAAAIVRSIQGKGTKPYPHILPTWNANASRFQADFEARLRARIAKI